MQSDALLLRQQSVEYKPLNDDVKHCRLLTFCEHVTRKVIYGGLSVGG